MENVITFTNTELMTVQNALNCYWLDAHNNLQKKDLGDIERRNYEQILVNSKQLMTKIDNEY